MLLYPLAFLIVRLPGYEQWGATPYGPMLEYGYDPHTPNADVVIFGDSSAFLDIDPRLIQAQLGTRAVVLPGTVGSLPVMGDAPLRFYLRHHAPPKLIVLYFSPWNTDLGHMATGRMFEGEEMLLRHGSFAENRTFWRQHPLELLRFPLRLYSTFGPGMLHAMLRRDDRAARTRAAFGHASYTDPFPTLNASCRIPSDFLQPHPTASLRDLKARYTTPATSVAVYLAPIPACGNASAWDSRAAGKLDAPLPALLPPAIFADDHYFAHVWPSFVAQPTGAFITWLRTRLR